MTNKVARLIILSAAIITAVASYEISKLTFDYEFEHFFPTSDDDLDFYQTFEAKFSNDVDFVLIAIQNEQGIFEQDFLNDARSMTEELNSVAHVKRVISPFNAPDFALGPFGPIAIQLLHVDEPERYAEDSTRIYKYNKMVGSLFSTDAKSLSCIVLLDQDMNKLETDTVYSDMMAVVDRYKFDQLHTAGKAIGQAYYIGQIKSEFAFFFLSGIALIMLVLIIIYRSFWGTVVPLLVVLLSVVWLMGFMGLVGKPIDIMIILLPLVLFVVGISDVIHLLSRYFEEIRNGKEKTEAIRTAYKKVGMATFLTSLTTAIGFFTLITSDIMPVKELGMFASLGVFVAFLLAFSLLPAILTLSSVPKLAYREPSTIFWNKLVRWIFIFSLRNRIKILVVFALAVVASIVGIQQVSIDNYLMEDMGKGDPHRKSFEFFEDHFAGVRPFELQVSVNDTTASLFEPKYVREMEKIERYLLEEYGEGVGFLNSPLNMIRTANQAMHGGKDSAYAIPADDAELDDALRLVSKFRKRPEFDALVTKDNSEARFSGKIRDVGGKTVKAMDEKFVAHFKVIEPLTGVHFRITGMSKLIDKNNENLSINMMSGLFFALLVVGVIMGLIFRSFRMVLLSLIPNIIPLICIGGFMGLAGIDLKVSTSVIFGIAFGIAVDDTIHYLSKFKQEIGQGKSLLYALKRTSISTGKAIILTTLVLCVGFLSLIASDFTSIYYVGLLISITLGLAVLADLFLLPGLLLLFYKQKK